MKIRVLFFCLFMPILLNCQIISNVELRLNGYHAFVNTNYSYTTNNYNTVYAYTRMPDGSEFDSIRIYKSIFGIVDPHSYLTFEPEITVRKKFLKNKFDIGLKYGIKLTKIKHDFAINPYHSRIVTILVLKAEESVYYHSLGIQLAYYLSKINSRIEIGIENSMPLRRTESHTRDILTDDANYLFQLDSDRNFKHGGGIWCYNLNYNYFITSHLFVGINYKFSKGGDATDRFGLYDIKNNRLTHEGYYVNGLRLLGLNVGYSLNF